MLYEKYRQKTLKVARFLQLVKRFRALILSVAAFIVASTATLLGIAGLVYEDGVCPPQIAYGERVSYQSSAIFTEVWYEYARLNSEEWSREMPVQVGEYAVRSVSKSVFGNPRYGKVQTFTVAPKVVNVEVVESQILYGETLTATAELAYGDSLSCTDFLYDDLSLPQTEVKANVESVVCYDQAGNDVTENYDLRCVKSEISFEKRNISVTVGSKTGEYDGKKLAFEQYEVSADTPLAWNEQAIATFGDYQLDVGQTDNAPQIRIFHDGVDVSANYQIALTKGTLTVESRVVYLTANDAQKVYDGTPLTEEGFTVSQGTLAEGQTVVSVGCASLTDVGTAENSMSFRFTDSEGKDVTNNYSVLLKTGTLTVTPRPVTLLSASNSWTYANTPYSEESHTVSESSPLPLAAGQTSQTQTSSQIIEVGEAENLFTACIFAGEEDVSQNYEITYEYGTLTITPRPVTFITGSVQLVYDGSAQSDGGHTPSENGLFLAEGHSSQSSEHSTLTDVGETPNKMTVRVYAGEEDVSKNYEISYEYGTLTITPRPVTLKASDGQKVYDGTPLLGEGYEVTSQLLLVEGQKAELSYVGSQTEAGESAVCIDEEGAQILNAEGVSVRGNYALSFEEGTLTVSKRPVTFLTATNEWIYDGELHSDGGHTLFENSLSLVEGHSTVSEGVTQRSEAGDSPNEMTVRVFLADEEMTDNYEISYEKGTLTVLPRPVSVITHSNEWLYDDTAHEEQGFTVTDEEYSLLSGHVAVASVCTQIINAGEKENAIKLLVFEGEIEKTGNYEFHYDYGSLKVNKRKLFVQTKNGEWVYSDVAQSNSSVTPLSGGDGLVGGHLLRSEKWTEITDVGEVENVVEVGVFRGESDCSENYEIAYTNGTLKVTHRPITVKSLSIKRVYYDQPISRKEYSLAGEYALVEWHQTQLVEYAERTEVGETENKIKVEILRTADGKPVTTNYQITYEYGTITVTQRPVILRPADKTKVYDGEEFFSDELTSAPTNLLVKGHTATGVTYHTQTGAYDYIDVGVYENALKLEGIVIWKDGSQDVTHNYQISVEVGELAITQRPVTVYPRHGEKVYDGTDLFAPAFCFEATGEPLVSGHQFTASTYSVGGKPEQIDVGEYQSAIEGRSAQIVDGTGRSVLHNYLFTFKIGTLKITPRPLTVKTASQTFYYNRKPHEYPVYSVENESENEGLVANEYLDCKDWATITEIGTAENAAILTVWSDARGVYTTLNYQITCLWGTLEVVEPSFNIIVLPIPIVSQYTGQPVSYGADDYFVSNLPAGYTFEMDLSAISLIDVGVVKAEEIYARPFTVYDENGNDVSDRGIITVNDSKGLLTVIPATITVTSANATKEYDGKPLKNGNYAVSGYLATGHRVEAEIVGEQTEVGSSENAIGKVVVYDENDEVVTVNYTVLYHTGTLTVT